MKFYQKPTGHNYQWSQTEETSRYHVSELVTGRGIASNRWAFSNRRPRSDSKFWDASRFMVWDSKENRQIRK